MAGFDPNQPRDKEGKWTEAGGAARKAAGLITFSRDEEVTTEKSLRLVEDAYTRIPESERLKSAAVSVLVFDDPEDVYAEAIRNGIEPEVDPEFGIIRGYYDFDKKQIVCSVWDGYKDSPKNFYHEFAHSIVGASEEAVAAWMEIYMKKEE